MFNFHVVHDNLDYTNRKSENVEEANGAHFYETEDSEESVSIYSQCSDNRFCKDNSFQASLSMFPDQQEAFLDFGRFDHTRHDTLSPPLQACLEEIEKFNEIKSGIQGFDQPKKRNQYQFSSTSFELLKGYVEGQKRLSRERIIKPSIDTTPSMEVSSHELSTENIVRVAGERF